MPTHRLYVGTYTESLPHAPHARGEGIYVFDFGAEGGLLGPARLAAEVDNPSFIALHPSGRHLYAVSETDAGQLSAWATDSATGALDFVSARPTGGSATTHVSVTPDGAVALVANYLSGAASVGAYSTRADGGLQGSASALHAGHGPHGERQDGPHAHCFQAAPTGEVACAVDLGTDEVVVYAVGPAGQLSRRSALAFPPGSGPRHIAFQPGGRLDFVTLGFVTLELSGEVASVRLDGKEGPQVLQVVSTRQGEGQNVPAGVGVSPDGRFVYVSVRGQDAILVYEVDGDTGALTLRGQHPSGGRTPRHFTLSPGGAFLLVGNQDSDSITVFRRSGQSGLLSEIGRFSCPTPTCLAFLPVLSGA